MRIKRIAGIIIFLLGLGFVGLAIYIKQEVELGKIKIANAEEKIDQGNRLFSLHPISKEIGKGVSRAAQRKIDAGKDQVVEYEKIANWSQIGGIVLLCIGASLVLFTRKKKRAK